MSANILSSSNPNEIFQNLRIIYAFRIFGKLQPTLLEGINIYDSIIKIILGTILIYFIEYQLKQKTREHFDKIIDFTNTILSISKLILMGFFALIFEIMFGLDENLFNLKTIFLELFYLQYLVCISLVVKYIF